MKDIQEKVCIRYGSKFEPVNANEMVAVAINSLGKIPITGIRHILKEGENISWFFYCGEFCDDDDFFKPMHIEHLSEHLPQVMPYLSLEQGFRFVIDNDGYEDVWKEE